VVGRVGEVQSRPVTAAPPKRTGQRLWALLATPGSLWLLAFLVVPFYAIAAIAFGYRDPLFGSTRPEWNPSYWDTTTFGETVRSTLAGDLRPVFVRTLAFVTLALVICVVIGYPVAYYLARHAGRRRGLLLALIRRRAAVWLLLAR